MLNSNTNFIITTQKTFTRVFFHLNNVDSFTIGSKILFTPTGGRFCVENSLYYLDLCHANPAYHKLMTFHLLKTVNQSKASRNCLRKICHLWGKRYFAAFGPFKQLVWVYTHKKGLIYFEQKHFKHNCWQKFTKYTTKQHINASTAYLFRI